MVATVRPTISTFSVTKGGRIAETYACFAAWDLAETLDTNLERLRQENTIHSRTDAWLKEMRRILRVRFGDIDTHRPLIRLAHAGFPQDLWAPILLWHLCKRELLLSDFLEAWLFDRKQEGVLRVHSEDVRRYLRDLGRRGLLDTEWSASTIGRMTSGLPTYAADFGLLQGSQVKEIAPAHLADEALLYVLYDIVSEQRAAENVLRDVRWRRFLLSRDDLEHELLRLHQRHELQYELAGSMVRLELRLRNLEEYVESLVG